LNKTDNANIYIKERPWLLPHKSGGYYDGARSLLQTLCKGFNADALEIVQ
jgi:hypothetical protein